MNLMSLQDAMAAMAQEEGDRDQFSISLGQAVQAYDHENRAIVTDDGMYVLTPNGFANLVRDRLGISTGVLRRFSPHIQSQMIRDLAAQQPDDDLTILVNRERQEITAVLSGGYFPVSGVQVMMALISMQNDGLIPPQAGIHQVHADRRGFAFRLVADEWNFNLSGNGTVDTAYGGLAVHNNSLGAGAMSVRPALARVSCFNYTLSEAVISVDHRFKEWGDFYRALRDGASHVDSYADEMAKLLRQTRQVDLASAQAVFNKVGDGLRLPSYARKAAAEYWYKNGSGTLFDVVQAYTFASQSLSSPPNKRARPRWDHRDIVERAVVKVATDIIKLGEEHFVTTVGDIISQLSSFDPDAEVDGVQEVIGSDENGRQIVHLR